MQNFNLEISPHAIAACLLWWAVQVPLAILAGNQFQVSPLSGTITLLLMLSLAYPLGNYLEFAMPHGLEASPPETTPPDTRPRKARVIPFNRVQKKRPTGKPNLRIIK